MAALDRDRTLAYAPLAGALLGLRPLPPLTTDAMAASLEVTFAPPHERTPRLERAAADLQRLLAATGAVVLPYPDALLPNGKIRPGVVVVEQGQGPTEELAIHHLTSLYRNPLVLLLDEPAPPALDAGPQPSLDAIVSTLAWNLTHIPIHVEDGAWTVCTMNGAVLRATQAELGHFVRDALVPKLAGQVAPPRRDVVAIREGAFAPLDLPDAAALARDVMDAGATWAASGLMLAHTSLDTLTYRDRYARRLVSSYLDRRTGMSYGFLLRQLPTAVRPAVPLEEAPAAVRDALAARPLARAGETGWARVPMAGIDWAVEVPDVWVVSTRSGCKKTEVDPATDLVRLGLAAGQVVLETPAGVPAAHARPSYDTMVMMAHAVGNALVAGLQQALAPDAAPLADALAGPGLSSSHWHGYPPPGVAPEGYAVFGADNPPVSCSTPQSAVYALVGKLAAFEASLAAGRPYAGDLHVEPHHGTNLTGTLTLAEGAAWAATHDPASLVAAPAAEVVTPHAA
ncbi:MAG TPA: hypothetical protein VK610_06990 [Rhodothermales bacterium]|nr:hypothetical protein [Rhodothermales bacterium]